MRFLTVLYVLCVTVLSYGSYDDRDEFYDPQFWLAWLAWLAMTAFFVVPLFLIWLWQKLREMLCVRLAVMEFVAEKRSGG